MIFYYRISTNDNTSSACFGAVGRVWSLRMLECSITAWPYIIHFWGRSHLTYVGLYQAVAVAGDDPPRMLEQITVAHKDKWGMFATATSCYIARVYHS